MAKIGLLSMWNQTRMISEKFLTYEAEHNHKDKRDWLQESAMQLIWWFFSFTQVISVVCLLICEASDIRRRQSNKTNSRKLSNRGNSVRFNFYLFHSVLHLCLDWIYIIEVISFSARTIKLKRQQHAQCKTKTELLLTASVFQKPQKKKHIHTQLSWESKGEFKI